MTSGPLHTPAGFEDLFDPCYVPYADTDIVGTLAPPDFDLVHRVHLISQPAPGQVTVCESAEGWRFLPGGRRELNETVHEAIARELREEAGTEPTGPVTFFFSHIATSRRREPYLPHVPHPVMWWTFGLCTSRVVGSPTAPPDAEQIVAVHHLPVAHAITWLAADTTDPVSTKVVRLAAHLGLI